MGCASSRSTSSDDTGTLQDRKSPADKIELRTRDEAKGEVGQPLKGESTSHPAPHVRASISVQGDSKVALGQQEETWATSFSSDGSSSEVVTAMKAASTSHSHSSGKSSPRADAGDDLGLKLSRHQTTLTRAGDQGLVSPGLLELGWSCAQEASPSNSFSKQEQSRGFTEVAKLQNGQDAEISMSDDEVEDENEQASCSEGFDIQRWRRYYQWNHRKPDDLLAFFWKRFDPTKWSLHCVSYRNQDALFAPFQGENVIHGVACRLEAVIRANTRAPVSATFGLLHSFTNGVVEKQKVLGIFIVRGQSVPSQLLHVLDEEEWALTKAEPGDPEVRQFVSGLLAPRPNKSLVDDFHITCSRVVC